MLVEERARRDVPEDRFGAERFNTFFGEREEEIRLRVRWLKTDGQHYISMKDWNNLSQGQRTHLRRNGVPQRFYYDGLPATAPKPAAGKPTRGVAAAPLSPTRTHVASEWRTPSQASARPASKPKAKPAKASKTPRKGPGAGRAFAWESEIGDFIFEHMTNRDDFIVKDYPSGLQVIHRATGRRMDRAQVMAFKALLESNGAPA